MDIGNPRSAARNSRHVREAVAKKRGSVARRTRSDLVCEVREQVCGEQIGRSSRPEQGVRIEQVSHRGSIIPNASSSRMASRRNLR